MTAAMLLTIDDSPSAQTEELTDFLSAHGVPAILFCRGDRLAANPAPVVRAIAKGFIAANHAWSHTRFSQLSYEDGVDEIRRTDALIDAAYAQAGVTRPAKYFRFPHMDRGCGGWIVDYDAAPAWREDLIGLFADGLYIDLTPPDEAAREKKARWQAFLKAEGFVPLPSAGITLPWYRETEMATAVDAMFTFSTSDWMLTPRHQGRHAYKKLEDLIRKVDNDAALARQDSHQIILAHDQDDLFPVVKALVTHMLKKDFIFIKPEGRDDGF